MDDLSFSLGRAFAAVLLASVASGLAIARLARRGSAGRDLAFQLWLALVTTGCLALGIEWTFRTFVFSSDGWHFTLGAQRWNQRYWKPINSLGYRDVEHRAEELAGRRVLFVVGDSFATGHGLEEIDDRFAAAIGRALGPDWSAVLVARNGWGPSDELEALRSHPLEPTAILLSYYLNDIAEGPTPVRRFVETPQGLTGWLARRSHAFDFYYWRLYRRGLGDEYWRHLQREFRSRETWERHTEALSAIVAHARERAADLSAIVWPHLADVAGSAELTAKVADFFAREGVPTLDVAPLLAGRPPADLVVNPLDVHPNRQLHAEVAREWMRAIGQGYARAAGAQAPDSDRFGGNSSKGKGASSRM